MNKSQLQEAHQIQEVTGEIPSYKVAGLTPKFARSVIQRQEYKDKIKELDILCDSLTEPLELELAQSGFKSVKVDSYLCTLVDSVRSSLSKEKLLELGVTPSQIQQATIETPCTFLKVTDTEKGKATRKEKRAGVVAIRGKKSGGSGGKKAKR